MFRPIVFLTLSLALFSAAARAEAVPDDLEPISAAEAAPAPAGPASTGGYVVGVNDVLSVSVLQPEVLQAELTVSPDGTITYPYIGNVTVKGKSLIEIQYQIQTALGDYMKYPLVAVSLKESRSRQFYVYGEVVHPGAYSMQDNLTALRAVSIAGGFTKYGSANKVKILRAKPEGGNDTIKADLKKAMDGDSSQDIKIVSGDIITVSEGVF